MSIIAVNDGESIKHFGVGISPNTTTAALFEAVIKIAESEISIAGEPTGKRIKLIACGSHRRFRFLLLLKRAKTSSRNRSMSNR